MSIHRKAQTLAVAALGTALVLLGVFVFSYRQSSRAEERIANLQALVADAIQLRTATIDYLLHREARPRLQAAAKLRDVQRFLAGSVAFIAEDSGRDERSAVLWLEVRRLAAEAEALFADLEQSAPGPEVRERDRRTAELLMLRSQALMLALTRLVDIAVADLAAANRLEVASLILLLAALAALAAMLYRFMQRDILSPLRRMQQTAGQVGEGRLELRLGGHGGPGDDELGQLAAAFDRTLDYLANALAQAESASVAKDRFLASMSHELRTPLNAIIGFTGTLLMRLPGPLTAEQERQLATIEASASHLLSLINDLLDLAKIESGNVDLHLEAVSCKSLIDEVTAALKPLAEKKGLAFEVVPLTEDILVRTDRRALSQIVINLANNAIKYTERGRVGVVCARCREAGASRIDIRVADTGVGIRPEDQARLFQAFTQLDPSSTRRVGGTGLGLHLSRKLAELIGGRISCASEPGKGSIFTLTLPEEARP